mmetsp:Transcript_3299/g.7749  ORF Transcript_3299/g.7749 Transcript_3299/m.7749 type:complete len:247 (+) Transcript_3299:666-1406(+)
MPKLLFSLDYLERALRRKRAEGCPPTERSQQRGSHPKRRRRWSAPRGLRGGGAGQQRRLSRRVVHEGVPVGAAGGVGELQPLVRRRLGVVVEPRDLPRPAVEGDVVEACDRQAALVAAVDKELLLPPHVDDRVPAEGVAPAALLLDRALDLLKAAELAPVHQVGVRPRLPLAGEEHVVGVVDDLPLPEGLHRELGVRDVLRLHDPREGPGLVLARDDGHVDAPVLVDPVQARRGDALRAAEVLSWP